MDFSLFVHGIGKVLWAVLAIGGMGILLYRGWEWRHGLKILAAFVAVVVVINGWSSGSSPFEILQAFLLGVVFWGAILFFIRRGKGWQAPGA